MSASLSKRAVAAFLGTFWLVLGGCGTAVLAAEWAGGGVGVIGVAFAFGLTVLTMVYAIGHISGAHLNPAISLGLWMGRRFPASDLAGLHRRPGSRRDRRGCRVVRHRQGHARLQPRTTASPPTATARTRPGATRWPPRWSASW